MVILPLDDAVLLLHLRDIEIGDLQLMMLSYMIPNLIVGRLAFRSSHIQFIHIDVHFDVPLDIEFGQKKDRFAMARGCLLLYHRGLSHPPFWRVFLFWFKDFAFGFKFWFQVLLFGFRGVVCYALRVEQVLNLAAQHSRYSPKLVYVRAFTVSSAPAFHGAVAQFRLAAKLPAAYPSGLAAFVYGVIGV